MIDQLADMALRLRFVIGYPTLVVSGLLLGVLAVARMRAMTNGRRRVYRLLTLIAFGLSWCGFWGIMGVAQYGTIIQSIGISLKPIGLAFSLGIIWVALWMATLTAVIMVDEQRCSTEQRGIAE